MGNVGNGGRGGRVATKHEQDGTTLVAAVHGMHGWLPRPLSETGERSDSGDSDVPPHKAA